MNKLIRRTIIIVILPPAFCFGGSNDFTISKAAALKIRSDETNMTHVTDFGDENGPYKFVAKVVVEPSDLVFSTHIYTTNSMKTSTESIGIDRTNSVYHVEFYLNESDNIFGVLNREPIGPPPPVPVVEEEPPVDNRDTDYIDMCEVAVWTIYGENTKLLEALLQAGLKVNAPLTIDNGWTALHYAAMSNCPRSAKVLLENGAWIESRGRGESGRRPIDYAYEDGHTEMCEILRKPAEKDTMIATYPRDLLEEVFRPKHTNEVRFLSINGKDPSNELLTYFRGYWPNVRPRSRAVEIDPRTIQKNQPQPKTMYCDQKTKDYGIVVSLSLTSDDETTYSWSHMEGGYPWGGAIGGKVSKAYGYWIIHDDYYADIF